MNGRGGREKCCREWAHEKICKNGSQKGHSETLQRKNGIVRSKIARFAQIDRTNEEGRGGAGGANNARGDLAAKLCPKRQTDIWGYTQLTSAKRLIERQGICYHKDPVSLSLLRRVSPAAGNEALF